MSLLTKCNPRFTDRVQPWISTSRRRCGARFDRDALARIVANLLDNAEKVDRDAADRTIRLPARAHGGMVEVAVEDRGHGVPDATTLFKPFARGTNGNDTFIEHPGALRAQPQAFVVCSKARVRSERSRHPEHMLPNVGEDQVGGHRRHLIQARLPELPLHVVLGGKSVSAVRLQADVGGLP